MYIAFKWLVGLSLGMWVAVCCKDMILKINKNTEKGFIVKPFGIIFKNSTTPKEKIGENRDKFNHESIIFLHCSIFIAGALAVTIFNRKTDIISFAKRRIVKINYAVLLTDIKVNLNKTAIHIGVAISKYTKLLWGLGRILFTKVNDATSLMKPRRVGYNTIHYVLLKKIKELDEVRKNLGQLLLFAIKENKSIRIQYQLESMAKSRLIRHIEQSQSQLKENRSKYVSFQQLYLVTHQENLFLKACIRKLRKKNEEVQKKLSELMNEIYRSKNAELKVYCSRYMVSSKDNLLNSDVKAEIQKFLQSNFHTKTVRSCWEISDQSEILVNTAKSRPRCNNVQITEMRQGEDSVLPIACGAPKLKGLPGECVWTVKDKDGIIEKLYEYDYETDFDNGDTIKRIRQYSVYYDKDCMLDFSNSSATIRDDLRKVSGSSSRSYPLASATFLTGSKAFQTFLQGNTELVNFPQKASQAPPLLYQ